VDFNSDNYHKVADLAEEQKGVRIIFKSQSLLMRILSKILFWLPKDQFMNGYTTTLGRTIYLSDHYAGMSEPSAGETATLVHELVHVEQFERLGRVPMSLAYLFPQCLALLSLFSLLAIGGNLWFLLCLLFLLFLAPLPAPWRMVYEVDAYCTGYAAFFWVHGKEVPLMDKQEIQRRLGGYLSQFTGWSYYKMWPFEEDLAKRFDRKLTALRLHDWSDLPFIAREVYEVVAGNDAPSDDA